MNKTNRFLSFSVVMAASLATVALPTSGFAADSGLVPSMSTKLTQRHSSNSSDDFSTDARQRYPWFVSLGAYFPNFSDDGVNTNTGVELAVGYRFVTDPADIRISARGQNFNINDGMGDNATISVSQLDIDALFRFGAVYFGPGVGFGNISGTSGGFTFSGDSATLWALTLGYDFTPRLFGEARWQTADVDGYKGYSVSVGYRF